ncbi:MAG TPA: hypothetical protein VMV44_07100 [Rectinemataceae bacterium]|nr:hypothetical protein [Rectinemataceae bacterium]
MTVGQKASLSLLGSVLLFAAFAVAAFSGFFNVLESRFYDPAVTRQYSDNLAAIAKATDVWNGLNFSRFAAALDSQAIKRSFLPNLSAQDAFDRANILGKLQADTPGLAGIRLIDVDGKRMHFSTFPGDILKKTDASILYRDYGSPDDLPPAKFELPVDSRGIFRVDEESGRLFYALPFSDENGLRRGTALFLLSPAGLLDALVKAGLVQVGDTLMPAGPAGLLFRAPMVEGDSLGARVAEAWGQGLGSRPITIGESSSGSSWTLLSASTNDGFRLGVLLPSSTFSIPLAMKILLLIAFFLTAYLLLFLLLNLRQEKSTIVSERIKRYQIGMLEASFAEKADHDLARWKRLLESRRAEYSEGIKADLGKLSPAQEAEAEELIQKSWDEIIAVLDRRVSDQDRIGSASIKEIERLIKEALGKASFVLPASALIPPQAPVPAASSPTAPTAKQAPPPRRAASPAALEEVEEAEALEEVEEAEALEEVEEAEALEEVEEAEALEEVDEAEALEEVEEAPLPAAPAVAAAEEEELEELAAIDGEEVFAGFSSASIDEDLIPVIPESAILELVDTADIGELMAFLDLGAMEERPLDLIDNVEDEETASTGELVEELVEVEAAKEEGGEVEALEVEAPAPMEAALDVEELAQSASTPPEEEPAEIDVIIGSPHRRGTQALEEANAPAIRLDLSSLDLSELSDMDSILDQLGELMATEVGAALPAMEGRSRPLDVPMLEYGGNFDRDSSDGKVTVDRDTPVDLVPTERGPADWEDFGATAQRRAWMDWRPVEGTLAVDDEPIEGGGEEFDEGEEPLEPIEPAGAGPIRLRDGIYRIEAEAVGKAELDPDFQRLIDAVLSEGLGKGRGERFVERP